jgi:hypothetical protein
MKSLKSVMTDKITLGGIGYFLAGVTLLVAIMGALVVMDYTSGRQILDGTLTTTAPAR